MNTSSSPIKDFLDAVDIVLNSNTFILQFDIQNKNLYTSTHDFLKSENFIEQLLKEDVERDWYNMHYFDENSEKYKVKEGNILNNEFSLEIKQLSFEKIEYLTALLTGDVTKGKFFSFYGKQKEKDEAEKIIENLAKELFGSNEWKLFILNTDFLKDGIGSYSKNDSLYYFDGDYGNDNAIVIASKNKGFLILTNGVD